MSTDGASFQSSQLIVASMCTFSIPRVSAGGQPRHMPRYPGSPPGACGAHLHILTLDIYRSVAAIVWSLQHHNEILWRALTQDLQQTVHAVRESVDSHRALLSNRLFTQVPRCFGQSVVRVIVDAAFLTEHFTADYAPYSARVDDYVHMNVANVVAESLAASSL